MGQILDEIKEISKQIVSHYERLGPAPAAAKYRPNGYPTFSLYKQFNGYEGTAKIEIFFRWNQYKKPKHVLRKARYAASKAAETIIEKELCDNISYSYIIIPKRKLTKKLLEEIIR